VPLGACFCASSSASHRRFFCLLFLLQLPAADLSPHLIASADCLQNHTGVAIIISTTPRKKIPMQNSSVYPVVLQDLQAQIWSEFLLCSHARNAVVVVVIVPQGFEVILKEFL